MKRLILATIVTGWFVTGAVTAQDTPGVKLGNRSAAQREEKTRVAPTEKLIYERAQYRAQQRTARLEAYKWMGVSPNRPTVPYAAFSTNLNPNLDWNLGYDPAWSARW